MHNVSLHPHFRDDEIKVQTGQDFEWIKLISRESAVLLGRDGSQHEIIKEEYVNSL
jgi:hypothetical protein